MVWSQDYDASYGRKARPKTLEAAICLAENTRDGLASDCEFTDTSSQKSTHYHAPAAKTEPTAMEIDNLEHRSRNSDAEPRRCYNCQGIGHIARQCPSPRMTSGRGGRPAPRATRPPPRVHALEVVLGMRGYRHHRVAGEIASKPPMLALLAHAILPLGPQISSNNADSASDTQRMAPATAL